MKSKEKKCEEKILLLTDIPPCKNYTGGIMISQLMRFLLEERKTVDCFCVMSKTLNPIFDESVINDINFTIQYKPEENLEISKMSKRKYYSQINKLLRKFLKYIKKNKITKIWVTMQGEVILTLVNAIKKKTNIDYVVEIWDPIEWWIKEHAFDEKRKNKVLKQYENAIKNASYCLTTSFMMRKEYSKKFNKNCIEVMPPLTQKKYIIAQEKKEKDKFVIAISGQIYAKEETATLLLALEKMNWHYKNKKIVFKYYGSWSNSYIDLNKFKNYKEKIIINNFLPQNKLLEELSYADLLYCPYFFSQDEALKKVSTLSFPSKLVSYLSLEVPTLMHAPKYASPYIFLEENKAAYLIDTNDVDKIIDQLKKIIGDKSDNVDNIIRNANYVFLNNFSFDVVKKNFFKALNIEFSPSKKLRILEVNNVDLPGRRFNGFDLQRMINNDTIHSAKQIVTYKTSSDKDVIKFFNFDQLIWKENILIKNEADILSVHSQVSLTSEVLINKDEFVNADVVHYHLIHNTKLSLHKMIDLCKSKPTVLTLHDPWNFTGRCVYPQECEKWKDGCIGCRCLDNLFPFNEDNCNSLWKLKEKVYKELDVDIVVTTPFMLNMIKASPLTRHFKNIHVIPFGIDLKKFSNSISKEDARKKLNINKDDIVLFFRAQMAMKGTEYIIEALKKLNTDKKITLLTCSETGLLNNFKNKYNVIDLGHIEDDEMIVAYNACDIFLMPSRGESFGLMAIEAMACSRPIIVFDNSALPYVTFAPECGVLVKNKDSLKLMEAIKDLIDNPKERERRGKLGRKLAIENYDINLYHQRIMKLYEEVYNRQKNKPIIYSKKKKIDYSSKDVQCLIKKLKLVFNKTFPNYELKTEFMKHNSSKDIKIGKRIDYSDDSVQGVIEEFNEYVYSVLKKEEEICLQNKKLSEEPIFDKFLFLLINDRQVLKERLKYKLGNKQLIYSIIRIPYITLREIKNIPVKIIHLFKKKMK